MDAIETIQNFLNSGQQSTVWLMVGIIALSYLLEDVAIVAAAGLALEGLLSPSLALVAIFIGIATGDLGLYYLGRSGRYFRGIRYKALTNRNFRSLRTKLRKNAFISLFVIRFIPGLRTVGFTLSGFFTIPLPIFLSAVIGATALWTGLVFSTIYYLGNAAWLQASQYQWVIIPCAILLLYGANKLINKSYSREQV
ncbi:DedA family protein [Vibrio makurazakiensis]|uniref:DedA family protein n=1 Tax=Vibrio makurazakiensis TaxID=2910250 RepID=UPI003D10E704